MPSDPGQKHFDRRTFLAGTAAATAAFALAPPLWADANPNKPEDLNIAIIGPGSQGRNLLLNCLKIPGIRFRAVCDAWEYHRIYAERILQKFDQPVHVYDDYREMLAKEKDLDAVIIATPDWVHHTHTIACLEAGLHVYCEKEMSNTLANAAKMVKAAHDTGKLLQIGHQRRSNPRYWHALKLIEKDQVLGRICAINGQWNRRHRLELSWPENRVIPTDRLKELGYESMEQFRNWRWYRQYSGGPLADLGSHQIDVYNWFLKANPSAVLASGGIDYYQTKGRDWYDNVMTIYEYDTQQAGQNQKVRAFYQVLNTTSHGGFYETFMGDEGTLVISEDSRKGFYFREPTSQVKREWEDQSEKVEAMGREAIQLKIGESLSPDGSKDPKAKQLLADVEKPVHQLHLENFFAAVRDPKKNKLSCPAEVGYDTAVSILKANDAVDKQERISFSSEDFKV